MATRSRLGDEVDRYQVAIWHVDEVSGSGVESKQQVVVANPMISESVRAMRKSKTNHKRLDFLVSRWFAGDKWLFRDDTDSARVQADVDHFLRERECLLCQVRALEVF